MAALVQSFPAPQTSTVTMLQTRPQSAAGNYQRVAQSQHHNRPTPMTRNPYSNPGGTIGSYRGQTTQAMMAPYALTSNPGYGMPGNGTQQQHSMMAGFRPEDRTSSSPMYLYSRAHIQGHPQRYPPPAADSISTSFATSLQPPSMTKDDSATVSSTSFQRPSQANARSVSLLNVNTTTSTIPNINANANANTNTTVKSSPERYRRVNRRAESSPPTTFPSSITRRSASPLGSGLAAVNQLYGPSIARAQSSGTASQVTPHVPFGDVPQSPSLRQSSGNVGTATTDSHLKTYSADDTRIPRQPGGEQAKRYHRRSVSSGLDGGDLAENPVNGQTTLSTRSQQLPQQLSQTWSEPGVTGREEHGEFGSPTPHSPHGQKTAAHHRNVSVDSSASSRSRVSEKRQIVVTPLTPLHANPVSVQQPTSNIHLSQGPRRQVINVPPRGASDPSRRMTNPSPLSRPATAGDSQSPGKKSNGEWPRKTVIREPSGPFEATASPASVQLLALNDKQERKGPKSRLRRAFSFGSAAELRKASAQNSMNNASHERARLRKERYADEQEAEQAAIAQKQEAGGIGENIYSGQGHVFTGSTDNLSISSTASSASVMIRKMGKGMKNSTRSLVGLFRPKSVFGVPPMEGIQPEPSMAQVSMVTVEAEREKVNASTEVYEENEGGVGYPQLELNFLERGTTDDALVLNPASNSISINGAIAGDLDSPSQVQLVRESIRNRRRSISGGDKERAEVLSAVKKGILKRSGTESGNSSPVVKPVDYQTPDFNLPMIPQVSDSPHSSAPSTPRDDKPPQLQLGHRRTDSVTIEGEDYFMSLPKFGFQDSKSAPGTPQSINRYNVSFSDSIQFHNTWTSGEYDRRGEIATCNRLTPMLAQQIKEELNTFKMEMEVHEHSKVYTHFF